MTKTILAVTVGMLMFLGVFSTIGMVNAVDSSCTIHVDKDGCVINQKTSRGDIKNSINIYANGGAGTTYDDTKVKADISALQAKDGEQDSATQGISTQVGNIANDLSNTANQVGSLQTALDNNGIGDNGTVARVATLEANLNNLTATVQKLAQEINDTTIVIEPVNQTGNGNQTGNQTGGGGGNQTGGGTGNQTGGGTGNQTGNQTGGGGNGTDGTFPDNGNGDSSPSSVGGDSGTGVVSTSWITNALTVLTKGS